MPYALLIRDRTRARRTRAPLLTPLLPPRCCLAGEEQRHAPALLHLLRHQRAVPAPLDAGAAPERGARQEILRALVVRAERPQHDRAYRHVAGECQHPAPTHRALSAPPPHVCRAAGTVAACHLALKASRRAATTSLRHRTLLRAPAPCACPHAPPALAQPISHFTFQLALDFEVASLSIGVPR